MLVDGIVYVTVYVLVPEPLGAATALGVTVAPNVQLDALKFNVPLAVPLAIGTNTLPPCVRLTVILGLLTLRM